MLIGVLCVVLGLTIFLEAARGGQPPTRYAYWGPILPADSALVRATEARIEVPTGFVPTSRCFIPVTGSINICFRRDPSVVLGNGQFAELMRIAGATSVQFAGCATPRRWNPRRDPSRLTIDACSGTGTRGPVGLEFFITSVLRITAASVAPSRRPDRVFPAGTQLDVVIKVVHHARPSENFVVDGDD